MRQNFIAAMVGSTAMTLVLLFSEPIAQANPQTATPSHRYVQESNQPLITQNVPQAIPDFSGAELSFGDVAVLNTGAEPRQILQILPEANTQQQSIIRVDMSGQMTAAGRTQTLPHIPTTMTLTTNVIHVDDGDNRYIEFEYTDAGVGETSGLPPEALDAVRSQLSQLVGLQGSWVQAPQGTISQLEMTTPETMSPILVQNLQQMLEGMQQMSAPFPTDAIGIGAQWQVPYTTSINGITMRGVATYEWVSHEGDVISLATRITQQGALTRSSLLGMNIGAQQVSTTGEGTIVMNLRQVMPIQSNLTMTTNSSFSVSHQENEIPVVMSLLINMTLVSE